MGIETIHKIVYAVALRTRFCCMWGWGQKRFTSNFLMKYILGIKKGMTQVFDDNGVCHPVTVLEALPGVVTQLRTPEKDGYTAVQIASGEQKEHRLSKAQQGVGKNARYVREFRTSQSAELKAGDAVSPEQFAEGDMVQVSATSKGKGFQGVVKRHGFAGGPKTHGNKHHERAPGSIGATGPARVFKGTKMAGRMGGDRVTVKNLQVVQVNAQDNVLLIRGAVPGRNGTVVEVVGK